MRQLFIALLILLSTTLLNTAFANGSGNYSANKPLIPAPAAHQKLASAQKSTPLPGINNVKPIRFTMQPGSLRSNLTKLAKQNGWSHIVWEPRHDFRWTGRVRLKFTSLFSAMSNLLTNYPLQARFYHGNHILVITSRNLK